MKKLTIPKYTLGEEVTNSITHGLGVFFGIVILVLTIVFLYRKFLQKCEILYDMKIKIFLDMSIYNKKRFKR